MNLPLQIGVIDVATQAYQDQRPGTSGLRKKVDHFQQPNYLENFIQSIFEVLKPSSVVVGGDGRYWSDVAIKKIINILVANGVSKVTTTQRGILSTPAASALIRTTQSDIGILLTASHNPGGPDGDFGVKINNKFGAPALECDTEKVFEFSKTITNYKNLLKNININMEKISSTEVNQSRVVVINPVGNYSDLMKQCFNFDLISKPFSSEQLTGGDQRPLKILIDCMNGVTGPYIKMIAKQLNIPDSMLMNTEPLPDFGGKHPDPNLTYAKELVDRMKANPDIDFGIAFDGDGDRNMVLGQAGFFVSPGDALAVFVNNQHLELRFNGYMKGSARSFPTAPALDRVTKKHNLKFHETPTGWKYFGELMESKFIFICGEESFGVGSSHIREKDGIWALLMWLSIMCSKKMTVKEVVEEHWKEYGRDYFNRYDYENCEASKCKVMMNELETLLMGKSLVGKKYGSKEQYIVAETGDFEFHNILTGKTTSNHQCLYVKFQDGSRIIVRLSGTGSCGATVRLYLNGYSKDDILRESEDFLGELLEIALSITKLREHTGRDKPDVIT